ncbi:hypothetical protein ENFAE_17720 [Enterococcus faecalis]|uniref:DUF1642 domain-containing protein n=1 Tax=Enterococcus faecalis TaxID=1351 RepID=UPI0008780044|nr:DUF1642 domain-containing protein [Enterococcus faecalis]OFA12361.1 hypothetical protein ENFAE_17720 [Enterococcus faecalis]
MNKQELIEELECLEIPADSYSYFRGAKYVVERSISLAKQLKESKKAVLPKTADDFIEESLGIGSDKVDIISSADYFSQEIPDDEFSLWFKSNRDLFVDALANGYEVKKEPLYYVKLPEIGYMRFGFCIPVTESIEEAKKYTEQEIKAIDERYWPFAVKVEEE